MNLSTSLMLRARKLRRGLFACWILLLGLLWCLPCSLRAQTNDYYWNAPLGGSGVWDFAANKWGLNNPAGPPTAAWVNGSSSRAIFEDTGGTLSLDPAGITAGGLVFTSSSYVLSGGTLTLVPAPGDGTPEINVHGIGVDATISCVLAGTSGLVKTGDGYLFLTNNANTFSGNVAINAGALVITDQGQLGTGATAISVNGIAQTGNPGFSGGQLVLQGSLSGMTFSRSVTVAGRGAGAANASAALVSVGNNTISGNLVVGNTTTETRLISAYGTTTVSGNVQIGSSQSTLFYGNGNWVVSGAISGFDTATDRFIKAGNLITTTMWLQNANNSFLQTIRIDSGTVRVSQVGALGANLTNQAIDLNNGVLEIHAQSLDFSSASIRKRGNGGGVFVDHALDSSAVGQTVALGNLILDNNSTSVLSGRNGYGATLTGAGGTINWAAGNQTTFTNNSSGLLTIDANINRLNDATARTITFNGNGDSFVTGDLLQTGTGAVSLSKTGRGTLTMLGSASNATGATTIGDGTLAVRNIGALPSGAINIGNATTTSGNLTFLGAAGTGAMGSVTNAIKINTTTANDVIFANQSGAAPTAVVLSGVFTAVAGNKILYLGGANYQNGIEIQLDNEITSQIPDSTTLSLSKIGTGTWVLSNQANLYTGVTTIYGGTLKLNATGGGATEIIKAGGAITFAADTAVNTGWMNSQTAAGTLQYNGFSSGSLTANTQSLGALTVTDGAATVSVLAGTNNTSALTFSSLTAPSYGTGLNFVTNAGGSVALTGATDTNGIIDAHVFYNGANFASGGAVGAATYTTVNDGSSLSSGNVLPYLVTAADITAQADATVNAGIKFSETRALTLASGATLTLQNGAATVSGGILVTGGTVGTPINVTISGGTGITSGGAADLVFRTDGRFDTLTLNTPILNNTTGGWTKLGDGTLVIGAANANTTAGFVSINEGTVRLTAGGKLGADSIDVKLRQNATLDLNGVDLGTASSGTGSLDILNGSGTITNSAASTSVSLRVGNGNSASAFTGLIQDGAGTIALVKAGSGTFALPGANTFSGGVTLNAGTLSATSLADYGAVSSIGTGSATTNAGSLVFNGGTLQYIGASSTANATIFQTTQTPSVSINRQFALAGDGTIDSSGSFGANFLGRTRNDAALVFNSNAAVSFSGSGNRTLTLTGDSLGDNEIALKLVDNPNGGVLNVTKSGGGLWYLSNTGNTYTGTTTVNGNGTLRIGADDSALTRTLPTTSALLLGTTTTSGVLQTSGTFSRPLAATATAGSVTFGGSTGGGFAASVAPLKVILGSAQWGAGGFVPNGATLLLSSTTSWADVDFKGGIDLNGANRMIQVDDNVNTGLDFATISGVISNSSGTNSSGFTKAGSGTLILGNNNTYDGDTTFSAGTLIVQSIGNATGTVSSSLGASGGALKLNVNNGNFIYAGAGETASRPVQITSGAATIRLVSEGSGALVLSNVANLATGAVTLELRGNSTAGNMIASTLSNSGANVLAITKSDGGVWILNPTSGPNAFTGAINAGGGSLGLTADGIGAASQINIGNGAIFAYGGDLATGVPVQLNNNTTAVFAGTHNITLNGNVTKQAGANDQTFSNNLEGGAVLTINGNFVNAQTAAATRTVNVRGYGSTVWNGLIQNNSATSLTRFDIRIADSASFTLGGDNSLTGGFTGGILLGQGTLVVSNVGGLGSAANPVVLDGGALQSTVDLTGVNTVLNKIQLQGDQVMIAGNQSIEFGAATAVEINGNRILRNELTGGATLTISGNITNTANNQTLTIRGTGTTIITGAVVNSGANAISLAWSGLGELDLMGNNTATGALTVNRDLVVLSGTTGGSWNNGTFVLNPTGILRLDNSGGNNPSGRLSNTGTFAGNGGTLDIIGFSGGSTHTAGALTLNGVQTYITTSGGPVDLTFTSVSDPNPGSSLNVAGVANIGTTNKVKFTAALPANMLINSVMPRVILGNDFATYDATNGISTFTNYNPTSATNINLAAATDTVEVNAGMTVTALSANKTINALKISGSGLNAGGTQGTLTLSAAAILNTGPAASSNTLGGYVVAFGSNAGFIQVADNTTLTVTSTLTGTGGLSKAQGGTLVLNTQSLVTSTTSVLNGTLQLNGGLNTLFQNQQLFVNAGATLDLRGNAQFTERLNDPGTLPDTGGTITSSVGTGTYVTNMGGSTVVATAIMGSVDFGRINGNTLSLESAQTYTGSTWLMGGTTTLENDASIRNSSSILVSAATLTLNNNSSLQTANYNRIGDAIPITIRTGTINFTGKVSDLSFENFGALTAASGANTITVNTTSSSVGAFTSADVTFASLTRATGATINFTGTNLGTAGNTSHIVFAASPTVYGDGLLGAWAIANSTDYAGYNSANGVGIVGNGGYAGYNSAFGAGNVTNLLALAPLTTTLSAGTTTTAMLRLAGAFTNDVAFTNNTDVLNLELGGILRSNNNNASSFGTTAVRGVITAGGTETSGTRELVIYSTGATTTNFAGGATTLGSNVISVTSTAGLSAGMTITNANLPAGTYIVSISNNGTDLTVSQNATATTTGQTFAGGTSNLIVNSVIANNGFGNSVALVKSGAGILNLSANNTYTGGTYVSQGTLNLIGSGVVLPAGGLTIDNAVVTMLTNNGQINPTNIVTLNGSSTVTLAGGAGADNTLAALVFNNNGGTTNPTVAVPNLSVLNLTSSAPITVTSNNAVTLPVIAGGTLALSGGANTIDVGAIQIAGQTYTAINPSLNIASVITGSGSIVKTGDGILQLSGANTYTGGTTVSAGGLLLAASSTPSALGSVVTSGPVGTGALVLASGTSLLTNANNRVIANDVTFGATTTLDTTLSTTSLLTLNGQLTLPGTGAVAFYVPNPFMTAQLLGQNTAGSLASVTSLTKTGPGNLIMNLTGINPTAAIDFRGNTTLSLLTDGDGTGSANVINLGVVTYDAIAPNITLGRTGLGTTTGPLLFQTALNKTIAPSSFVASLGNGVVLANNNGYGLLVSNNYALDATLGTAGPVFNIASASNSNAVQGLTLTGQITGGATGSGNVVFTKSGAGTLALTNSLNSYGGGGSIIDITQGVLSVSSKGALGNSANVIRLNPSTGTSTLRVTDDVTLGVSDPTIGFGNTANTRAIEVMQGKTLQLNAAFDLSGGATASLAKNDNGTLAINASNAGWTGAITINSGAILVQNSGALGTGALGIATTTGAALQLSGGVTVSNPLTITVATNGISNMGAIESVSGVNTYSGNLTQNNGFVVTLGADSGATLNVAGTWTSVNSATLNAAGTGIINVQTALPNIGTGAALNKIGSGIANLTVSSPTFVAPINVNDGTLYLGGSGVKVGGTGLITVQNPGATLVVDDSTGTTANRLGGRALTLTGGSFQYIGGSSASSETMGALTATRGTNTITANSGAGTSVLTFANLASNIVTVDGYLNFAGTGLGTSGNKILFSTAPTLTNGIIQRATVNGVDFAAYGANGIAAFAAYNVSNDISGAAATDTLSITADPIFTASKTINAFKISGSINAIGTAPVGATLTLSSGGILSSAGSNAVSFPVVAFGGTQGMIVVDSGELTINSLLTGTAGFQKDGAGTLVLNAVPNGAGIANISGQTLTGNVSVNGGTLKLAGGSNTLTPNQFLIVAPGATLDLNGTAQYAIGTRGDGATFQGNAGTFTNSGAGKAALIFGADISNGGANFGGVIKEDTGAGALGFLKASGQTYNFYNANTYSGPTVFAGGLNELRDGGTLSNTSSIGIYYAELRLNDNNNYYTPNRINAAAPIELRGGNLTYLNGRANLATTQSVGAVTLVEGSNQILATSGGGTVNSTELHIASLSRPAGSTATVRFSASTAGAVGSVARIYIETPPVLVSNIIGPWAVNDREWATYIPSSALSGGVAQLNSAGAAGYDGTTLPTAGQPTQNIRLATSAALTGNLTLNTLVVAAGNTTLDLGNSTLTLQGGGLLLSNATDNSTITVTNGKITSGVAGTGGDLYLWAAAYGGTNRAFTLASDAIITDNAGGAVRLIKASASTDTLTINGANTYSGGTVINGGTIILGSTGVLPEGGITINGGQSAAAVLTQNAGGVINSANTVTLNGNATLNLYGNNTLQGLVLNDTGGGSAGPLVNTFVPGSAASVGALTLGTGGITATNLDVASASSVAGRLVLSAAPTSINVGSVDFNGFIALAPTSPGLIIQGLQGGAGGFTKQGTGLLQFNAQSVYTGPTTLAAGGLQLGVTNGGSRFSDVTLAAGSRLNLNGFDTTIGSLGGAGVVTNNGATKTLTVGFSGADSTFSGEFDRWNDATPAALNLVKIGAGTMTITGNTSNALGSLTINRGTIAFKDNGINNFTSATVTVNEGGVLKLDNNGTADVANRLQGSAAAPPNLTMNGGDFIFIGRAGTASTETLGVLTLGPSATTFTVNNGASGTSSVTFASLTQQGGGTANFLGSSLGTDSKVMFITAPTLANGILARLAVNTSDFATYDATNGVIAFTGYTVRTDINTGANTETVKVDATTLVRDLTAARTVNALNIVDNGVTIGTNGTLLPTQGLTVSSGGVLVNGNSAAIGTPVLAYGNTEGILRVNGSSLNVTGSITGTAGVTKTGAGALTLSAEQSYTGQTALNLRNFTLAGGNNTILVAPTATIPTVSNLQVNGGTFDLNGNSQVVGTLLDSNTLAFVAGTITNSSATPVTFTSATGTASVFGAQLTGNLSFTKSGNGTLQFADQQTYTGATTLRGSTLTLQDKGALTNTSSVTLNFAGIVLNNGNLTTAADLNPIRIPQAAPITLLGGSITLTGGGSIDNSATFNSVTVLGGANTIVANRLDNQGATISLTIGNLVRTANGSTINFGPDIGQLGYAGSQIYLTNVNGAAPTDGVFLGSWAVVNSGEFAAYSTAQGVGRYGSAGFPSYATTFATGNITQVTATTALTAGGATAGALRLAAGATLDITFAAANDALNLETGALLRSNNNNASTIGTATIRGVLTAGGTATSGTTDLIVYNNSNTITINSVIADNGFGGVTRYVKSGAGAQTLTAVNTYTGGTIVNQGTLNLNGTTAGFVVIPTGGLTINDSTVTMNTNAGQIDSTTNVTLNGGALLTLTGSNTLNSVAFNNPGGRNLTPTVNAATLLTLSSLTPITAVNDNYSFTPTISGTEVMLADGATITTSGLSSNSLIISAKISTAGSTTPLTKSGTGSLILTSGSNAFANGINLNQGSIIFGNNAAAGTGTLALATGVAILSDNNRTLANNVTVAGSFTFGMLDDVNGARANATNNLTLSGTVTLAPGAHIITVGGLLMTGTIAGQLTGGTNLSKDGPGTLVLSKNTNDYGGFTTVNAGTLQLGAAGVIPDASAVTVASGAALNLNAFSESVGSLAGGGLVTNPGNAVTLTIGNDGTSTTFSGIINSSNPANLILTKVGGGTQTLAGTGLYAGATNVSGGTLSVTGSIVGAGNVSVASGAKLQGTGSVNGAVSVSSGATIAGGTGGTAGLLEKLTINNNVTVSAGGALRLDMTPTLSVTTPGNVGANSSYISLLGAQTLDLGASGSFSIDLYDNGLAQSPQTYVLTLAQLDPTNGVLKVGGNTISPGSQIMSGYTLNVSNFTGSGIDYTYLTYTNGNLLQLTVATPEPQYAILICMAAMLVVIIFRRLRSRRVCGAA